MSSTGRFIAKERGSHMSSRERLMSLVQRRPGAVLTAMAQLPDSDIRDLKWVSRKVLASLSASC